MIAGTGLLTADAAESAKIHLVPGPKRGATTAVSSNALSKPACQTLWFKHCWGRDNRITVKIPAKTGVNSSLSQNHNAISGIGVANLYEYIVDRALKAGKLISLFPDWEQNQRSLFAVYQQRRDSSPKIEAFLGFLEKILS